MLKLSIITVCLNNIDGLRKTLNSVVTQTYKEMEWVVVDGGSNDGTYELLKTNSDKIGQWISEKDNGVYQAMNKGIRMAQGEYLLFLNAGDTLIKDTIIEQIFNHVGLSADLCFGKTWYINGDHKSPMGNHPVDFTFHQFISDPLPHSGGTFYRRQLFLDYGLYDEKYYMSGDVDFNLRVIFKQQCSVQKIDLFISYFDGNGLSQHPNKDIHWEFGYYINKYYPRILGSDYTTFGNSKDRRHALKIWDTINSNWYIRIPYKLFLRPFVK